MILGNKPGIAKTTKIAVLSGIVDGNNQSVKGIVSGTGDLMLEGWFIIKRTPDSPENHYTLVKKTSNAVYATYNVIDRNSVLGLFSGDTLEITKMTSYFKNTQGAKSIAAKFEAKLKVRAAEENPADEILTSVDGKNTAKINEILRNIDSGFDEAYAFTEESSKFVDIIGTADAQDYQLKSVKITRERSGAPKIIVNAD